MDWPDPPQNAPTSVEDAPRHGFGHEDGPGSRAHVRQTLARAGAARARAAALRVRSGSLLAQADALAAEAEHTRVGSAAVQAELRASVAAYARRLRGEGARPERMLVLVKEAVREAAPHGLDPAEARALLGDVVRWSIDAYFHAA